MADQAEIHRKTRSRNTLERVEAAIQFCDTFASLPDKEQAWKDLSKLIYDTDNDVRWNATKALGYAFPHVPDKKQAWDDLHKLVKDKYLFVRWNAADALSVALPYIPDKKRACEDLHWLIKDEHSYVRLSAAKALGHGFSHIPDKKQAWIDLNSLTKDEEIYVRAFAIYSLGRASIFKATETKTQQDFKRELEKALEFFEKSLNIQPVSNPASFCLPFYRSFYVITFKNQEAEVEIRKYIANAKQAAEHSDSKEILLEAMENLAAALKEAMGAKEGTLKDMKVELSAYRKYCLRASELLDMIEEKAPAAAKLLKKGLPIIDKKIKKLFEEIEEKVKKFCKESSQTPFEKISKSAYESVKELGGVTSPIEAEIRLNRLSPLLRSVSMILPQENRKVIINQLDEIEAAGLHDKAIIIENTMNSIFTQLNLQELKSDKTCKFNEYLKNLVLQRLDSINYDTLQFKYKSDEIVPALLEITYELNQLKKIKNDFDNFGISLADLENLNHKDIQRLKNEITILCEEIETKIIPILPESIDTQILLKKLRDLKWSEEESWFNRVAELSSIIGYLLKIL